MPAAQCPSDAMPAAQYPAGAKASPQCPSAAMAAPQYPPFENLRASRVQWLRRNVLRQQCLWQQCPSAARSSLNGITTLISDSDRSEHEVKRIARAEGIALKKIQFKNDYNFFYL
jgi:hypothetical protein